VVEEATVVPEDEPVLFVKVVAVEYAVLIEGVIVMLEFRDGCIPAAGRSVAVSAFSGIVVLSRSNWLKYGPQRRAIRCELTGMRSPLIARKSMSASSRIPKAIWPNSAAAGERIRPPAFISRPSECSGALTDAKAEFGATLRGLSYRPKASSSTTHIFEKLMRR
jgi:hypothetical protein